MFIGVLLNYLYQGKLMTYVAWSGILILFVLFYAQWSVGPYGDSLALAWSYLFALSTFSFAYYFPNLFKGNRVFDFLANISYPLYVVHGVFGYVGLRIMLDLGLNAEASLVLVTSSCLLLAWFIHVLIERPTQRLGKRLGNRFN
jgi:peptidoglycan/LPS O-acetylase OafA/YrhL